MKAQIIAQFLYIPLTLSWVIPADLEDGMYRVEIPEGVEEVDNSSAIAIRTNGGNTALKSRDSNQPNDAVVPGGPPIRYSGQVPAVMVPFPIDMYDCQFNVPPLQLSSYEWASESFKAFCDRHGVAPRTKHINLSKKGDVVVYMCNTDDKPNWCERSEFDWVQQHVFNRHCGQLTPAWGASVSTHKVYGRGWKGQRICDDQHLSKTTWVGTPDNMPTDDDISDQEKYAVLHEWSSQLEAGSDPNEDNPDFGKPKHPVPQPGNGTSEISSDTSEADDSTELDNDSTAILPDSKVAEEVEESTSSGGRIMRYF